MTELSHSQIPTPLSKVSPLRVTSVANPRWGNSTQTLLDVDVTFKGDSTMHAYTAMANADTPDGIAIWIAANKGIYGPISPYVAPILSDDQIASQNKRQAKILLAQGDVIFRRIQE